MSEDANAENASDTVASALRNLAAAVAGLDDWHPIRDWALKGGGELLPPGGRTGRSVRVCGLAGVRGGGWSRPPADAVVAWRVRPR